MSYETNTLILPLKLVNNLFTSLACIIKDNKITTLNIVLISTKLMQIVENYPKISGIQKKALVTHILKKFVTDQLDVDNETLLMFIDMFLPTVIDAIVMVDKKELAIKIHKGLKSCFSC